MEYAFSFNGRMLVMLGVVLVLLMALCFGLGMLYGETGRASARAAQVAVPQAARPIIKEEAK